MGCCINYFIGFENAHTLDNMLQMLADRAVIVGFKIGKFEITANRKTLTIEPHKNSEWLCFDFMKVGDWATSGEHLFCGAEIQNANWGDTDSLWRKGHCTFLHKDLWYCANFTKTEYAPKSTHAKICELLRMVSPFASLFCVRDEANFYETRSRENLQKGHGYLAGEKVNDIK